MPELPEVEISRRQLTRWCAGRTLRAVHIEDPATVRGSLTSRPSAALPDGAERLRALVGRAADEPVRHGKRLGWSFGPLALLAHYGMSGRWVRAVPGATPPPLARVGLAFDEVTAWYLDGRRFGCLVPVPSAGLAEQIRAGCGPDALVPPIDARTLRARVSCRKPLKVALMEQDRVAGLGNIHAAEACFRARLSPLERADGLAEADWGGLAEAIHAQLQATVDADANADDFVYVNQGGPNPFQVYDRAGEPCPRCGATIASEEQAGRTTFWCPSCQRPGR